ncbi:MAG: CdaR family protein [Verrucomicrobiia bacterium]
MATRDWITKDFGWKLFSLILAVALWITVRRSLSEEPAAMSATPVSVIPFSSVDTLTFTNLPVFAVSADADVHNAQIVPKVVAVRLSGPSEILAILEENKVHAVVNLTGIDAASGLRLPVDVSVPPGVAIDKIDPPKVGVTFSPATE